MRILMNSTRFLTAVAAVALLAGPVAAKPAHKAAPAKPAAEAPPAEPACDAKTAPTTMTPIQAAGDTVATLKASGQFTIFLRAADLTNITLLLQQQKNLTLFAPTDAAFNALPADQLDLLLRSDHREQLQKLLTYHMINAPVRTADFKCSAQSVPTLARTPVQLNGETVYKVNGANIIQADIATSNGIIQVIDKVLSPTGAPAPAAASGTAAPAAATTSQPK
jgi:uncharacterized surface protein with fasciclin (FAS1) repeats